MLCEKRVNFLNVCSMFTACYNDVEYELSMHCAQKVYET